MTKKRDLFNELIEGFDALAEQRSGKRPLRAHAVKVKPAPNMASRELTRVREAMNLSRGLLASYLAHEGAHARELGTGTRETECARRAAHSLGPEISGHCTPPGGYMISSGDGRSGCSPMCQECAELRLGVP